MAIRDLMPSRWKKSDVPVRREEEHPFVAVQRDVNRIFDDFFRGFDALPFGGLGERLGAFQPSLDVRETDKEIVVKIELPGIEEKDVEVLLSDDALTIRGQKKEDREDEGRGYCFRERSYGSFQRVIPLPEGIDGEHVACRFKGGILAVHVPKTDVTASRAKKVPIRTE